MTVATIPDDGAPFAGAPPYHRVGGSPDLPPHGRPVVVHAPGRVCPRGRMHRSHGLLDRVRPRVQSLTEREPDVVARADQRDRLAPAAGEPRRAGEPSRYAGLP